MRAGLAMAVHHTRHRAAFGTALADQPLMRNVLADLAIESEAATHTALRIARAYDHSDEDAGEHAFARLATAVEKYWICKRAGAFSAEALECLGGNGYVEDSGMPLLYRDSILSGIWEGSGNVAALDVLRAMAKSPESVTAFMGECRRAEGANTDLDVHLDHVESQIAELWQADDEQAAQFGARRLVEDMATALQASLLVRNAPSAVSDAFCAARLADGGHVYGTLPAGLDTRSIVARALA
jgi:putative acyl-CoA dehydrogenase